MFFKKKKLAQINPLVLSVRVNFKFFLLKMSFFFDNPLDKFNRMS
ncbi:MAG: hypothetical protein RIS64_3496 [Bacteroidota bacterium]|jgi:hypothetical protein